MVVGDAVHEPVGLERVFHGETLAQELGVPRERRVRCGLGDAGGEARGRADGHRALADDERAVGEVRQQRLDRGVDVGEVGGVRAGGLRGADGDEVHLGARGIGDVGAEAQPAGRGRRGEDLGQPGLEERRTPGRERGDLRFVDVDADDVMPEFGHRRGVHGAEIPATDHRDTHGIPLVDNPDHSALRAGRDIRSAAPARPPQQLLERAAADVAPPEPGEEHRADDEADEQLPGVVGADAVVRCASDMAMTMRCSV